MTEEQYILCIDDDSNFLKSMEFLLPEKVNKSGDQMAWYRCLFYDNPLNALDTIKDINSEGDTVAMIMSDQKMPQMKGIEFLLETKKVCPDSIRVLLTGYAGLESAITAINNNLLDKYFTKPIEDENDLILNINHLLQRFQMKRTITDQSKLIHDLYTFSNVLNSIEDFQNTLDYTVEFAEVTLKCSRISIMLCEGDMLKIKAAKGLPDEVIQSAGIPVGGRIAGEVFQSKKAIIARTTDEIPYIDKVVNSESGSFISAPILYAGLTSSDRPLGVINVTNKADNNPFTEADMETLTYIANTASIAIHNQFNHIKLQQAYSETRTQAATLKYQMTHDPLTGLTNRMHLKDILQQAIISRRPEDSGFSMFLMDLDNFKEINDTLGHHNGDIILQEVASRLQQLFDKSDIVARIGGDEFAVLLNGINRDESSSIAGKIMEAIRRPYSLEGLTLQVDASIGISFCPEHGEESGLIIQRAEVAMYLAKRSGEGYGVFSAEKDPYNSRRLVIISDLRKAIDDDQLRLYYQPKIALDTGRIAGVEALVRWKHPEYGFMPPDQFIPIAEQTGLIKPLTIWVLNEALRQCRARCDNGIDVGVAVNLSVRNLQDIQLPAQIAELLKKWDISPRLLELEITESLVMSNPDISMETLRQLSAMGMTLSIDDFGTGHSSLSYLNKLPVSEIKIDKSFIKGLGTSNSDEMIVQATIELGHNLGFTVVAEGVESKVILDRLRHLRCNVAQGFFISPPIPWEDLNIWIINHSK